MKRVLISIPEHQHAYMKANGINMSEFVRQAIAERHGVPYATVKRGRPVEKKEETP